MRPKVDSGLNRRPYFRWTALLKPAFFMSKLSLLKNRFDLKTNPGCSSTETKGMYCFRLSLGVAKRKDIGIQKQMPMSTKNLFTSMSFIFCSICKCKYKTSLRILDEKGLDFLSRFGVLIQITCFLQLTCNEF